MKYVTELPWKAIIGGSWLGSWMYFWICTLCNRVCIIHCLIFRVVWWEGDPSSPYSAAKSEIPKAVLLWQADSALLFILCGTECFLHDGASLPCCNSAKLYWVWLLSCDIYIRYFMESLYYEYVYMLFNSYGVWAENKINSLL